MASMEFSCISLSDLIFNLDKMLSVETFLVGINAKVSLFAWWKEQFLVSSRIASVIQHIKNVERLWFVPTTLMRNKYSMNN